MNTISPDQNIFTSKATSFIKNQLSEPTGDISKLNQKEEKSFEKQELTAKQKKELKELKKRDREVREHEQAHMRAAGQYAKRSPNFEYEIGADGRKYAVEGEVELNISEIPNNPEATIKKMQQIQRAALAPVDPSAQDRRVASEAAVVEAKTRREASNQKQEELQSSPGVQSTNTISQIYNTTNNPVSVGQNINNLI